MSNHPRLPKSSDFPPGTEFVIKEFDVPLARVPGRGWFNWFGGAPRPYDPVYLRVDNNWPAESFEDWVRVVEESLPPAKAQQDDPNGVAGRTPAMERLWQNRNERTGPAIKKSSKYSHSPSGQRQPAPFELYPDEEWAVWYVDTFDRDFPPRSEVSGRGLVKGLTQLWARHLFETVRPDGQSGFSSFHLKWRQGRVEIDGDREGAKRLRGWMFGKKEASYKGYAAEADPALLKKIATVHAHLLERRQKAEQILAVARAAKDGADFANRLDDLIKK